MSKKAHETALPKLRFPEFRDAEAWQVPSLGELMEGVSKRNRDNKISRVFTNSAVSGIIDQRDFFDKDIATAGNTDNYTVIELGDYVYNPRISEFAPVGPTSRNKLGQGIVSPLYTVFRFRNSNHNEFYDYYFGSTHWQNSLKAIGNSGARHDRMGISLTQLRLVKVPYPSLAEQQKIATTLSSLDALLTAQTAKLTALQAHKRGLMQDLFPAEGETLPKRRFPEFRDAKEWKQEKLGKMIEIKGRIGYRGYTVADIVGPGEGAISLSPSNINDGWDLTFGKSTFISWDKYNESPEIMLRDGFTVLVKTGSTYGKAALVKNLPAKATINPQIVVLKPLRINNVFLYLIVSNSAVQEQIEKSVVGGAIPTLSQDSISKFDVLIPSELEQQKIADCLSSLDNLITAQSQKIEALKLHKKGLMQALFPASSEPNA